MIQCQNCGQSNTAESQFCRFCGTRFLARQSAEPQHFEYQAPRPYSWKTDEFQTQTESRQTTALNAVPQAGPVSRYVPAAATQQGIDFMDPNYRCPHCMSQFLPKLERRISTAGWITFAVLIVAFFPLFWIGLLIKEDVRVCPSCGRRLDR